MTKSVRSVLVATAILTLVSINVQGAFGDLDATFGGGDGKVPFHSSGANAKALVRQKDGKFIAVGAYADGSGLNNFQLLVRRFNADGTVDTSFGSGGTAIAYNSYGIAKAVAIQTDGKILVGGKGGTDSLNNTSAYVWRFNTNGWYDTGFGTNGRALVGSSSGGVGTVTAFKTSTSSLVAESILVSYGGTIKRLNSNGTTNTGFATGGTLTGFGGIFTKQNASSSAAATITVVHLFNGYTIMRGFTADGDVDTSFGNGGMTISFYGDYLNLSLRGLIRTNQDKIVVWAWYCAPGGDPGCITYPGVIASHSAAGVLENTNGSIGYMPGGVRFNPDGTLIIFASSYMTQLAPNLTMIQQSYQGSCSDHFIQPDGKIVCSEFADIERRLQ